MLLVGKGGSVIPTEFHMVFFHSPSNVWNRKKKEESINRDESNKEQDGKEGKEKK
jgi:enterochelin esterase-like enzyme